MFGRVVAENGTSEPAAAVCALIAVGVTNGAVVATGFDNHDGVRTVSSAWITPFVASRFLAWMDAPLTLRPFTSVNINSSPVTAFLVGAVTRLAAMTLPGRM